MANTNFINVPASDKQIHYLKQLAALQFPGSVDNYATKSPIHVLQHRLQRNEDISLAKVIDYGYDLCDGARFYDSSMNEFDSISELIASELGIDDGEIAKYNAENPERPFIKYEELDPTYDNRSDYIPYEKRPDFLRNVCDEEGYVNAYSQDTDLDSTDICVSLMDDNYEALGYAFTHQALLDVKESMSNHIYNPCRTYADCGEGFGREAGDFYPLMDFMRSAGEQLLAADAEKYEIMEKGHRTPDEISAFYKDHPEELLLAAEFDVYEKDAGDFYKNIQVYLQGHLNTTSSGDMYMLNSKHYVLAKDKNGFVGKYPYPFDCDKSIRYLVESASDSVFSGYQRLFFWTEYKKADALD